MVSTAPLTLRQRASRAVRTEITTAAMELFARQGFDTTTMDQVAVAAGVSRRTLFRYFGTKEDIVLGDVAAIGERVRSALEARPSHESAWTALRAAFQTLRDPDHPLEADLTAAQLYHDTPSLRSRHLEKHLRWQDLLAPGVARRLGVPAGDGHDWRARAVIAAALACLDVAVEAWRASGGTADLGQLYDEAVAAVRAG